MVFAKFGFFSVAFLKHFDEKGCVAILFDVGEVSSLVRASSDLVCDSEAGEVAFADLDPSVLGIAIGVECLVFHMVIDNR